MVSRSWGPGIVGHSFFIYLSFILIVIGIFMCSNHIELTINVSRKIAIEYESKISIFFLPIYFLGSGRLIEILKFWMHFVFKLESTPIQDPSFHSDSYEGAKNNHHQYISFDLVIEKNECHGQSYHQQLHNEKFDIVLGEYFHISVEQ